MSLLGRRLRNAGPLILILVVAFALPGVTFWGLDAPQSLTVLLVALAAFFWVTEWISLFSVSFVILAVEVVALVPLLNESQAERAVTPELFFQPFFSNIILLFLGSFVLASLIRKAGLDRLLAGILLSRCQGSPQRLLWVTLGTCALLSMWVSNTATAAMMMTAVLPITQALPEGHPFRKRLAIAIPFACNVGGLGTPIGSPPNAIALSYLEKSGLSVSFLGWAMALVPFVVVLLVCLFYLLRWAFPERPSDEGVVFDLQEWAQDRAAPLTSLQWGVLALFSVTFLLWMTSDWHGWRSGTVALVPVVAAFALGWQDETDFRKLPWDVLFMVGGGLALGTAVSASGLDIRLLQAVPDGTGFFALSAIVLLLTALLTTFVSNTATANLVMPVVGVFLAQLESTSAALMIGVAFMCSAAMALPISTPPNAMAFSSGAIRAKDLIRVGVLITGVGYALVLSLGLWVWSVLG